MSEAVQKSSTFSTDIPQQGEFSIVSLNVSTDVGTRKFPVQSVEFVTDFGIQGDAHAGRLVNRQISLLAIEEIEEASCKLAEVRQDVALNLKPGDFGENITTRGITLHRLPLGTHLYLGSVELVVSQIGKECHTSCEIRKLVGDCVMPRKGIFARVLVGGIITNEVRCYYRI
ncbi:MAG TPA: MOSC domain-containing protein [Spirochaetales bacterium]|nr:MOSC domain-containing protein [Spirochaetales bacterium]